MDILRDRERGVPRYNQFRRLFHKPSVKTLRGADCDNKEWAEEIRRVYDGDIEKVDLLVGLMAEPLPEGLRLQRHGLPRVHPDGVAPPEERPVPVGRTTRPEIYTQEGIDWVESTSMIDIIKRHDPGVEPALAGIDERVSSLAKGGLDHGLRRDLPAAAVQEPDRQEPAVPLEHLRPVRQLRRLGQPGAHQLGDASSPRAAWARSSRRSCRCTCAAASCRTTR